MEVKQLNGKATQLTGKTAKLIQIGSFNTDC